MYKATTHYFSGSMHIVQYSNCRVDPLLVNKMTWSGKRYGAVMEHALCCYQHFVKKRYCCGVSPLLSALGQEEVLLWSMTFAVSTWPGRGTVVENIYVVVSTWSKTDPVTDFDCFDVSIDQAEVQYWYGVPLCLKT